MSTNIRWYSKEANREIQFYYSFAQHLNCIQRLPNSINVPLSPFLVKPFVFFHKMLQHLSEREFHPVINHGSQFNQNILKYYFSQNYGSYQAFLIVNIIRSDFAPKRAKLQEHIFGPNQTSPLDTNVHELMKLVSAIR